MDLALHNHSSERLAGYLSVSGAAMEPQSRRSGDPERVSRAHEDDPCIQP